MKVLGTESRARARAWAWFRAGACACVRAWGGARSRSVRFAWAALAALTTFTTPTAWAQPVQLAGQMGAKAVLVIGGQPKTLAVGETHAGVKLLSAQAGVAEIEREGQRLTLRLGEAPVALGAATGAPPGREVVLSADTAGHFVAEGSVNGRSARFLVDTGATAVTLSQTEADRLGLDWRRAPRAQATTANGAVPASVITLASVRLGEVTVSSVPAIVLPAQLPYILLGNTFLSRFQMRRDNDVMRLELKP